MLVAGMARNEASGKSLATTPRHKWKIFCIFEIDKKTTALWAIVAI